MRKSNFRKHIEQLNEEELRSEIEYLYDRIKEVKEYYRMELGSTKDRKRQFEKAKKEIASKYKTKSKRRPRRPRIQKLKRILADLEKLSVFSHELIDVYLFDVETALQFSIEYGYFTQVLHNNIVNSLSRALDLIESNQLKAEYEERCIGILSQSRYIVELDNELDPLIKEVYH